MGRTRALDVLIVSLGSTEGLRRADEELLDALQRAGASVAMARASPPPPRRTLMLTDLGWARAARVSADSAVHPFGTQGLEAGRALQRDRLHRGGAAHVEVRAVALLDRRHGGLLAPPRE